jgi:hypothetical protein
MQLALILMASILSAWIFDMLSIIRKVNSVIGLSKESLEVMKSPDMDDDTQQKLLLSISGKVFLSTIKISVSMIAIAVPFVAIHITEVLTMGTSSFAERLGSLTGIGVSLLGFLCYFGAKRIYAHFGL